MSVSYTHLDVYKRQALDLACLRPEQSILGLILADDDDNLAQHSVICFVHLSSVTSVTWCIQYCFIVAIVSIESYILFFVKWNIFRLLSNCGVIQFVYYYYIRYSDHSTTVCIAYFMYCLLIGTFHAIKRTGSIY